MQYFTIAELLALCGSKAQTLKICWYLVEAGQAQWHSDWSGLFIQNGLAYLFTQKEA